MESAPKVFADHEIAVVVFVARSNRLEDLLPLVETALEIIPGLTNGHIFRIAG